MQQQFHTCFKIADTEDEINQIQTLTYQTFCEEIPLFNQNNEKKIIDRFHRDNIYLIGKQNQEVVTMTALRTIRPFSLDISLGHIESHLPSHCHIFECRLVCIKKEYRHGLMVVELFRKIIEYARDHEYDLCIASATTNQLSLYIRAGFKIFGKPVIFNNIEFHPAYATLDVVCKNLAVPQFINN